MRFTRASLINGSSLAVMAFIVCAPAVALADEKVAAANLEEVVVTGSRIQSGFQTPTPVTVATAQALKDSAPGNLADGLNQLPVFNNSLKSSQQTGGGINGGPGQNLLNLRNLGTNRVLVLLDGRRLVSTNDGGSTDLNVLPQNLVSRVDVVTGGASAAYGSDAVAGVVNFILDTKFQGLKGEIQGGQSKYSDSQQFSANIAWGHQFLGGKLRTIASAEFFRQAGVGIDVTNPRTWQRVAAGQIPNPVANARPAVFVVPDLKADLGSNGGLITQAGALRGTQFLANGVSAPFVYGAIQGSTYMSGGDPNAGDPGNGMSPDQKRTTTFGHAEYDLTDNTTLFADGLYSRAHVAIKGAWNFATGATSQLVITRDNAYLPADILARMVAANLQTVTLGRYFREWSPTENESIVDLHRFTGGARGKVMGNWSWDASYAYSSSDQKLAKNHVPNLRNLFAASDAVRNPAGQIVCRSTLTGFDPGCVPLNPFGIGSASKEAENYILGNSIKNLRLEQQVWAANLSGDFGDKLQLSAGPISIAVGAEYRKETANQTADAVSTQVVSLTGLRAGAAPASIAGRLGPFQFYNPQPLAGSFNIKEYYAEVGVPLLRDLPFVKVLDLSLAGRHAEYSQSGGVTTWKYGFNYEVNDQLRFRYTKSRDIRGPSILELFNSQSQTNQTIVYKGSTTATVNLTSGNAGLAPERGTTETYGVVYRPSWIPGLQLSLDRYTIGIVDAIGNLTAQQTADQCTAGNQAACDQITVGNNAGTTILTIRLRPLNLSVEQNSGYDFEGAYNTQLFGGTLQLRALMSHITEAFRIAPGAAPIQTLGSPATPKWRGTYSIQYSRDSWSALISERFIGKALIDPTKVEGIDTNHNNLPVIAYTNLTVKKKLEVAGGNQELFLTISNLLNQKPPVSGGNPTSYNTPAANAYDRDGRYYTIGLRWALQ